MANVNQNTLTKFGTLYNNEIQRAKFNHLHGRYRVSMIGYGATGEAAFLTANMQKFTPPQGSFETQTIDYVNGEIKYAGKWTWSASSFAVFNTYDNSVERALQNQLQRQRDMAEQTTGDAPSGYKFTTVFERTDGHQNTVCYWVLEGCWLTKAQEDEASNNDHGTSVISCEMVFDNATLYDRDGVMIPRTSSSVVSDPAEAYAY